MDVFLHPALAFARRPHWVRYISLTSLITAGCNLVLCFIPTRLGGGCVQLQRQVHELSPWMLTFACVRVWGHLCVRVYNWEQREHPPSQHLWLIFGDNKWGFSLCRCAFTGCLCPSCSHSLSLAPSLSALFVSFVRNCGNPKTVAAQGSLQHSGLDLAVWVAVGAEFWKLLPGRSRGRRESDAERGRAREGRKSVKMERLALRLSGGGGGKRQRGVNRLRPRGTRSGKKKRSCEDSGDSADCTYAAIQSRADSAGVRPGHTSPHQFPV